MSYNKTTWNSGDIITAQKLNKIENGIENTSSGLYSPRIINLSELTSSTDNDDNAISSGYEMGLAKEDFIGAWLLGENTLVPIEYISIDTQKYTTPLICLIGHGDEYIYYDPITGNFIQFIDDAASVK